MVKDFITYLKNVKLYSLYRRSSKDGRNELYKLYLSYRLSTYGYVIHSYGGIIAPL